MLTCIVVPGAAGRYRKREARSGVGLSINFRTERPWKRNPATSRVSSFESMPLSILISLCFFSLEAAICTTKDPLVSPRADLPRSEKADLFPQTELEKLSAGLERPDRAEMQFAFMCICVALIAMAACEKSCVRWTVVGDSNWTLSRCSVALSLSRKE